MNKTQIGVIFIAFSIIAAMFTLWINNDIKKLNQYLHKDCTLPADVCPFNALVPPQTIIGAIISGALAAFGILLIILGKREIKSRIVDIKKIEEVVKSLGGDEKIVYDTIVAAEGTIFQSELVGKSGLDKVRVSRVLDKLEGKGLIERKRRGMSNVIILRH